MIKRFSCILLFIFLSTVIYCDSPLVQAYLQRFINADISGKIQILNEAISDNDMNSPLLYEHALLFVLDNNAQFNDLRDMNTIISISLRGLHNRAVTRNSNVQNLTNVLWKLFLEYSDSDIQADIMITLGIVGKGNNELIYNLNNYLMNINRRFRQGDSVDYYIVSVCITAIMELGCSSSYPVLFAIICSGFPEIISFEAYGALEMIPGNLYQFLLNVIEHNPPDEKFAAFRAVMGSKRLTVSESGQIAELALAQTLLVGNENRNLLLMRYESVIKLTQLRWTRANALAIRHYYLVQADFNQNIVSKDRFLEAITCLGAVGNSDAALTLGLQLGLINIRTKSTEVFDAEITFAIVQSLGLIGDNAAFNHLSDVVDLPYTDNIIAAAREAINRLKW